jgi:hypothetical protein
MNICHHRQWILVELAALIVSGVISIDTSTLAASKRWEKETKQPVVPIPAAADSQRSPKASRMQSGIQSRERIGKGLAVESAQKPPIRTVGPANRRVKDNKKHRPQATVKAKPDLSYHGILQRPQRYALGKDHRKGGSPNPHIGDVLHEHFQELDKNHDGAIDPIERATGRIDLDRDL